MGHPTLRQRAKSLKKGDLTKARFKNLLSDMVDTLRDYGGVGLAAPQINESLRVVIIEIRDTNLRYGVQKLFPLTVFVNPEIELIDSQTAGFWEGCFWVWGQVLLGVLRSFFFEVLCLLCLLRWGLRLL